MTVFGDQESILGTERTRATLNLPYSVCAPNLRPYLVQYCTVLVVLLRIFLDLGINTVANCGPCADPTCTEGRIVARCLASICSVRYLLPHQHVINYDTLK